jgi:hypothetical protein
MSVDKRFKALFDPSDKTSEFHVEKWQMVKPLVSASFLGVWPRSSGHQEARNETGISVNPPWGRTVLGRSFCRSMIDAALCI